MELPRNLDSLSNETIDYYIDFLYQDAIGSLTADTLNRCFCPLDDSSKKNVRVISAPTTSRANVNQKVEPSSQLLPVPLILSKAVIRRKGTRPATPASGKKRKSKKQVAKPTSKKIYIAKKEEPHHCENTKTKTKPDSSTDVLQPVASSSTKAIQKSISQRFKDKLFGSSDQHQSSTLNHKKMDNGQHANIKAKVDSGLIKRTSLNTAINIDGKENVNTSVVTPVISSQLDDELHALNKTPEISSFAHRRNMWERRSLAPSFKFQR